MIVKGQFIRKAGVFYVDALLQWSTMTVTRDHIAQTLGRYLGQHPGECAGLAELSEALIIRRRHPDPICLVAELGIAVIRGEAVQDASHVSDRRFISTGLRVRR
jgi:hypothetical protein